MFLNEKNIILLIALISVTFAILAFFLILLVYVNARANARRQLELMKAAFQTQEEERARIARDLHDSIGQQISAVRLHLGLLLEIQDSSELKASVVEKQQMLSRANDELRLITRNLMPVTIADYGLIAELQALKMNLNRTNNIELEVKIEKEDERFRSDFEINLFRILQELINNTIKYANASRIYISFTSDASKLNILYYDNGEGFDPQQVKSGLGLKNIEARVKFYHGNYLVQSDVKKGARYRLIFDRNQIGI